MLKCWNSNQHERPRFVEVQFLSGVTNNQLVNELSAIKKKIKQSTIKQKIVEDKTEPYDLRPEGSASKGTFDDYQKSPAYSKNFVEV